ncbi:hypothetical protein LUZ61_015343 [Rhynchospora tenuis]|uniref:PGG domain-containing protein n=1 Tax=Rhynchospora tenuis TaxID=198213 RepID=A0AAD5WD67_9POAL|nr:hypothetical protein LUZ61_015343 [Rhynchospora tenuis]
MAEEINFQLARSNEVSKPKTPLMDRQLLKACTKNDLKLFRQLIDRNPDILFSVTPHENNCLHLAAMLGHQDLAEEIWSMAPSGPSLFSCTNKDGETPLIVALMAGNAPLATDILTAASGLLQPDTEGGHPLNEMLMKIDERGDNALHHAIRNGFEKLALKFLTIEPQLSEDIEPRLSEDIKPRQPVDLEQLQSDDIKHPSLPLKVKIHSLPAVQPLLKRTGKSTSLASDDKVEYPEGTESESESELRVRKESAMFMAARKGYSELVEKMLEIPSSGYYGPRGYSALEAAAHHSAIFEKLLRERPELAHRTSEEGLTPLTACMTEHNTIKILLEYDPFLAYVKNRGDPEAYGGFSPFLVAAQLGLVPVAQEIITACPDSAYLTDEKTKENALHIAIRYNQKEFVNFILNTRLLHRLINQVDHKGQLPLHIAAKMCNPEILRCLIAHERQDSTAINAKCHSAVDIVCERKKLWSTLKWAESFLSVSNAIPNGWRNLITYVTESSMKQQAIKEVKSLIARDTNNTSLIAVLLATITFAAAFTLPGGLSNGPTGDCPASGDCPTDDGGLPIFAWKPAFQVFLISDTIAMCSSLAVAFLNILATWEDLDYLLNYRKTTRPLMWCAYAATVVAFGTGVFTVMEPKRLWLAILILVLCCILPFLTKIIADWPKIKLRLRFGRQFRSDLLPTM